jgi:prolipoprotein diacylglyceryltransferase
MKASVKVFHWLPRIICILAILFIGMFSLDVFAPGLTIWQQLGGFLMHNIPSFVLLAILIVAWKWELTGGIIFIVLGLIFCLLVYLLNHYRNQFSVGQSLLNATIIAIPIVIVGILFIWSHNKKKKDLSVI